MNYTYLHSESDSDVPIPGASKHAANVTGYYENDRFSVRLSWNYRSKFFVDYDVERGFRPLFMDNIWSLDASAQVNVTENIALTLDAQNLTDEVIEEFYDDDPGRPARFYKNGRRVLRGHPRQVLGPPARAGRSQPPGPRSRGPLRASPLAGLSFPWPGREPAKASTSCGSSFRFFDGLAGPCSGPPPPCAWPARRRRPVPVAIVPAPVSVDGRDRNR